MHAVLHWATISNKINFKRKKKRQKRRRKKKRKMKVTKRKKRMLKRVDLLIEVSEVQNQADQLINKTEENVIRITNNEKSHNFKT